MRRPMCKLATLMLVPVLIGAAACAKTETTTPPGGTTPPPAGAAAATVEVKTFSFVPQSLSVKPGTKVTWNNSDPAPHQPTSGEPGKETKDFSVELAANGSGSTTLATAGTFKYFCSLHPTMTGEIIVSADNTGTTMGSTGTTVPGSGKDPTASELRTGLTMLLNEHTILAAAATGAALGGRDDEYKAAAAQLDKNSDTIADAIGLVYGDDAGTAFSGLWKRHIGFFVDYATGLGANDKAKADKAVTDLTAYADTFAAFLSGASPALPKDVVAGLVKDHILSLKDVVDAQAAKDPVTAFTSLGKAVDHMHKIADPLADAIAKQFPDRFKGSASSKASGLAATLNSLLEQHLAYAAAATKAALGGRTDEFEAAKSLLGKNTDDLTAAVASVFGQQAADAFKGSWNTHIGFFVDYTTAVGANDDAAKKKAAADLDGYAATLAAFFNSALPDLPVATLQGLIKTHITGLEAVIDAQGAKDWTKAYAALSDAMGHMEKIGTPLAASISKSMPEKFPTT